MRQGIGILVTIALASCRPSGPTPPGPSDTKPEHPQPARIEPAQMMATIEALASDELGGRYSLHSDIDRAASVLAQKFEAAGVEPVGDDFRHPFDITVGADLVSDPAISISRGPRVTEAPAGSFGPMPGSATGSVRGPLVFVGYGAAANDPTDYDDLADVDVTGAIAVVLLDAPRRPDSRALYERIRSIGDRYESQARPLRDAGDEDALSKLQRLTRDELGALIKPFLGGAPVPEALMQVPDDPTAPLQADAFASALFMPTASDGPTFPFSAGRLRNKLARLVDAGAIGIITVRGPRSFIDDASRDEDPLPELATTRPARDVGVPVVQMKWREADRILKIGSRKLSSLQGQIERELEPASAGLKAEATLSVELRPRNVQAPNLLGQIVGKRTDEFVILGAHYDHIGTDEDGRGHCRAIVEGETKDVVCNGADDNASGTAVVVEVARVLASRPEPPERTVVFALFAGEELGLLGSRAMAASPPAAWKGATPVAMVNIDMVGRLRPDPGLLVGGVGSSPQWMGLFETAGWGDIPITFDRSITTRSDHAAFYKLGMPVIFMFTGVHGDYHAPGDEASRIDPVGLGKVGNLTLGVIEQIAGGAAIEFAEPATPEEGLVPALPGDIEATIERRVNYAPTP
ncbi:MAG: M28 family peptidase [Nannocystaceae bacterium]|nr:M20/M25/M40 family metallo-hydrolase [bacterium]